MNVTKQPRYSLKKPTTTKKQQPDMSKFLAASGVVCFMLREFNGVERSEVSLNMYIGEYSVSMC